MCKKGLSSYVNNWEVSQQSTDQQRVQCVLYFPGFNRSAIKALYFYIHASGAEITN